MARFGAEESVPEALVWAFPMVMSDELGRWCINPVWDKLGLAELLYRTRCEIGIPSWVIRLIMEEATRASTCCASNLRARSVGPMRVL
jgi:hypothetical protein